MSKPGRPYGRGGAGSSKQFLIPPDRVDKHAGFLTSVPAQRTGTPCPLFGESELAHFTYVHIALLDRLAIFEKSLEVVAAGFRAVIDVNIDGLARLEGIAVQNVFFPVLCSYAGCIELGHGDAGLVDDGDYPVCRKRGVKGKSCGQCSQGDNTTAYKRGHDLPANESRWKAS